MTRFRMPAVSMNFQILPPSSTSSSTGSTVVPDASSTTTRSSPASLFSSEDLPTFGRPMIAIRRGPPIGSPKRLLRRLRQGGQDRVEHVAGAAAVQRRDRVRLAEAEVPEAVGLRLGALVVDLVRRQDHRAAALAQHLDDRLVGVGDADGRVDHEQHRVGQRDRDLGLGGDPLGQTLGVRVPAAGVDDREGAAVPVRVVGDPVPGHARACPRRPPHGGR